jgi:hypothetical protein
MQLVIDGKSYTVPAEVGELLHMVSVERDQLQSEWISVEDRLPEERDCYIVWDSQYDSAFQATFDVDYQEFISSFDKEKFKDACVTHWRPLPAPPEV